MQQKVHNMASRTKQRKPGFKDIKLTDLNAIERAKKLLDETVTEIVESPSISKDDIDAYIKKLEKGLLDLNIKIEKPSVIIRMLNAKISESSDNTIIKSVLIEVKKEYLKALTLKSIDQIGG